MVSFGIYCSKCVGHGFKKTGAGAITIVAVVGSIAVKALLGGKGKSWLIKNTYQDSWFIIIYYFR